MLNLYMLDSPTVHTVYPVVSRVQGLMKLVWLRYFHPALMQKFKKSTESTKRVCSTSPSAPKNVYSLHPFDDISWGFILLTQQQSVCGFLEVTFSDVLLQNTNELHLFIYFFNLNPQTLCFQSMEKSWRMPSAATPPDTSADSWCLSAR